MSIENGENAFDSSISLNTTQEWQFIQGNLGSDNTNDYYSFNLTNRSSFELALNNLSDNADVKLLNENNLVVASLSPRNIQDEGIKRVLNAGTYFIEVHQAGNSEIDYGLEYRSNYIPETFKFDTEVTEGGLRLTDTSIVDGDGVDDIAKVDFWLKKQGGNWSKIGNVSEFNPNSDGSIGFNYDISNLEDGKYYLWGRATDKFGARSNGWGKVFQVENFVNPEVKNVAPSNLDFDIETVAQGIKLSNAKVYDADGVDDLERVEFELTKEGERIEIQDAVNFSQNQDGSIGFDYSIANLAAGKYELKATAYDQAGNGSESLQSDFRINNSAPSQLDFTFQRINGGIKLQDTKIFDADGINDLEKVDFELKKEGGEWVDIEDALNFSMNQDGSIGFEYSINGLEQGNYQLKATAYDTAGNGSEPLTTYFKVNNAAPSELLFEIETFDDGVRVVDAQVFDANGIDDLTRVDFWLKKDDDKWQNIADAVEFRDNGNGKFSFDYSIDSLEAGDYVLWARTRDKADSYSDVWQKSFQIVDKTLESQPQQDWFSNLQDESIRELTRSRFVDNSISRSDMIAILRDAGDDNQVDATEMNDFRTIINNAAYLGIQDYVRGLSNIVVNGDVANKSGILQVGSSTEHLNQLINKWFLGSDRPQTPHTYQYAQGSLFQNGISHDDIRQGYINDCFFLAGLGATLVQSPEIIQNMFIDNGDGTFTVRFYNKGVADYVTVDRYLPTNNIGNFVYASPGDNYADANNELWVALAEKAYAQLNESGWINQDNTNSYNGIGNAGYLSDAFAHITGERTALGRILNFEQVVNAFNSGEVVGFGSKSSGVESNIVTSHAYALVDYNPQTQKFTLLNPWSTDNTALKSRTLELSWSEISSNFSYWDSTISNVVST